MSMVQQFQFFTQTYEYTTKISLSAHKMQDRMSDEYLSFCKDFENKVNEQLKQGWKLLNVNYLPQAFGIIMQAFLVKDG